MTEREQLWQAVLAAPDDDAPRLAFADWLEDHGDPTRAEFIRVQIALSREPEYTPRYRELERKQDAFLKAHKKEWIASVRGVTSIALLRRGFVDQVTMDVKLFAQRSAKLFEAEPVRAVKFVTSFWVDEAGRRSALSCPELAQLREVQAEVFRGGDELAAEIAASPFARTVRSLHASRSQDATSAGLAILVGLPALETFGLDEGYGFGGRAGEELARLPGPSRLKRLRLNCTLRDSDAVGFAAAGVLGELRSLSLSHAWRYGDSTVGLSDQALMAFASSKPLGGLDTLDLTKAGRFTDRGVGTLADAPVMARLRVLRLAYGRIGDRAVRRIVESPLAANLECLDLHDCDVTDDGVAPLLDAARLPKLIRLVLTGNKIATTRKGLLARFGRGNVSLSPT